MTDLAVNLEKLTSECTPAPMSEDVFFKASASLKVLNGFGAEVLQNALGNLADDLIVDITSSDSGGFV